MRFNRLLIRLIAPFVPRDRRAAWRKEWEAELFHRDQELASWRSASARSSLRRLAPGLVKDAVWLRVQRLREGLLLDMRLALRALFRRPLGSLLVAAVVGGSIAATVVVFVLVDSILWQPLPFADSEQLVRVSQQHPAQAPNGSTVSRADLADLRQNTTSLSHVAGWYVFPRTLRAGEAPEVLSVAQVSTDFFSMLGVTPHLGRTFTGDETSVSTFNSANSPQAADPLIVLSHSYWQSRLAGDPDVLGSSVELERRRWRVIGVMPPTFSFPDTSVQAWIPWSFDNATHRDQRYLSGVGKLKDGWTLDAARAEVENVAVVMAEGHPDSNQDWTITLEPLADATAAPIRGALQAGVAAVLSVFLLALLDVGMLQWVRAQRLMGGYAVRRALGSSRSRVVRGVLIETSLPALIGGLAGGAVAVAAVRWLPHNNSEWLSLPRIDELSWTSRTTAFWLVCVVVVSVATALPSALQALRGRGGLNGSTSRRYTGSRRLTRGVAAVVVAEIAIATALVSGSASLLQSWSNLLNVDPGMKAENVVVAPMMLDNNHYDGAGSRRFHEALRQRLLQLPGVDSAASSTVLPMSPIGPDFARPVFKPASQITRTEAPYADVRMVTPELFDTLEIPILRGRDFGPEDRPESERVVVISADLAARLFGSDGLSGSATDGGAVARAVGQQVVIDYSEYDYQATVVGVVGDVLQSGLQGTAKPSIYIPHAQRPYLAMSLAIRLSPKAPASVEALQAAILELDPAQPPHSITPLTSLVSRSIDRERLTGGLVSAFGVLALALAALGLYGVLAAAVSARGDELAVRLAFGARPRDLEGLVLRRSVGFLALGLVLGVSLATVFGWVLSSLLFGTSVLDPRSLLLTVAVLSSTLLFAAWLPARRAGRTAAPRVLST